ncbi:VOC family protein [Adhaeribacter terreus]|uniref:VOC family protein n=1 Tax=Adhaeribacter terreus TaxID=529703 RepID=A0ABW0EFV2_9BACT
MVPEMNGENWPVVQVRIARPTDQLEKVTAFYAQGLGLKILGSFEAHEGYNGVMLGLPGFPYHLEFTSHEHGSPCPAPTKDNLLVLYMPDSNAINAIENRLKSMGYFTVTPENPYWLAKGLTFEDPDGWRVVLMQTPGIS